MSVGGRELFSGFSINTILVSMFEGSCSDKVILFVTTGLFSPCDKPGALPFRA